MEFFKKGVGSCWKFLWAQFGPGLVNSPQYLLPSQLGSKLQGRQSEHWIELSTSVAGTTMTGSSFTPASSKSHHAIVSGHKTARIAAYIFVDSVSLSLGKFFPKNSDIYLFTFGTRQTSTCMSGRGYSIKRASLVLLGQIPPYLQFWFRWGRDKDSFS